MTTFYKRHSHLIFRGLVLTLDAEEYSFRDKDGSSISISMDGSCSSNECDGYFAFSIGDQQYLTFITDFDGRYDVNLNEGAAREGIFVYPACNSGSVATGDASGLIPHGFTRRTIRDALSGGDDENFYRLTETPNDENFPVVFEFINNADSGTFTFKFSSPTFTTSLECTYTSAVTTGEDFKLFITPDGGNERIKIDSFTVTGYLLSFYVYILTVNL